MSVASTSPLANWNGEELPLDQVRVSVLDRSFLFGDAVYEVLRVFHGRPFLLGEHFQRLRRSLGELRINADVDRLEQRLWTTLRNSGVRDGVIYLHVSRGAAPARTHQFPTVPTLPNELIFVRELAADHYADLHERGAAAILVPDLRWKRCDIKSVNLLGNVLAAQAAVEAGCDEAILVTADGTISEGSHTSVFGVADGCILTAPLEANVLPGITRQLVVQLAGRAGIPIRESPLRRDGIERLSELFLTGTTIDVLPVTRVDGRPIGDGRPGPIAARLRTAYQEAAAEACGKG